MECPSSCKWSDGRWQSQQCAVPVMRDRRTCFAMLKMTTPWPLTHRLPSSLCHLYGSSSDPVTQALKISQRLPSACGIRAGLEVIQTFPLPTSSHLCISVSLQHESGPSGFPTVLSTAVLSSPSPCPSIPFLWAGWLRALPHAVSVDFCLISLERFDIEFSPLLFILFVPSSLMLSTFIIFFIYLFSFYYPLSSRKSEVYKLTFPALHLFLSDSVSLCS